MVVSGSPSQSWPKEVRLRMPAARSTAWWPSANRADSPASSEERKMCNVTSRSVRAMSTDSRGMCDGELLMQIESEALVGDGLS